VEVCAVQLPGRENRLLEPPFTRLEPLVEALAGALLPYLDRPYALFGHSMGGLLGFELIRRLRRLGAPTPQRFFVSACRAPQLPRRARPIHDLPDDELVESLRAFRGTPTRVLQDRELMQLVLPALRADFGVLETYAYTAEARLECPLEVFGGLQDETVPLPELAGWSDQAGREYSQRMLPGHHFFLHEGEGRRILLRAIGASLALVPRPWPSAARAATTRFEAA
jgi:medium-chain acyl-[acyl-carrier-protein] hydrolase